MRTNNLTVTFCAIIFGLCASSFAGMSDVEYFDFSGWDDGLISNGGQTFTDVCGDIDVTVTSFGTFTSTGAAGTQVMTHHATPASASLKFTFSQPLELVVATNTVDADEVHSIFGVGPESYTHESGAAPTVATVGSGISITGNGYGINPTGAAFGDTTTGPTAVLTLTYEALGTTAPGLEKYGQWMIGKVVPEPNSVALLGIGGFGMLMQLRRKRRA